jgi:hypothetical protein
VVELPPIAIIDDEYMTPPQIATMSIASVQAQVSTTLELNEAQRLSDVTVQEWFARRVRTSDASPTLVEEGDKRLATMLARKRLGELQQALTKTCVADAVAPAISLTLFK